MKRLLQAFEHLRDRKVAQLPAFTAYHDTEVAIRLRELMLENYNVNNLKNVADDQFQSHITSLPGQQSLPVEDYVDPNYQRDQSVQFEWGHNHDFGSFFMPGQMKNRHIDILATFMQVYGIPEYDLRGKTILDIGCWTGGTSLLLAAMGAQVIAIEEVRMYAESVNYMKNAFDIDNLSVQNRSLFSLNNQEFFDRFDIVLYSGVLYHVTDPILSLRVVFNCIRDGGICLLETMAIRNKGSYCTYQGATETLSKVKSEKPRTGWNWFVPSLEALVRMMTDVGFNVQKATLHEGHRALAVGTREHHTDMLRAGLSDQNTR